MPKPILTDAKTVLSADGRKVRVLFYDDGSYRFRVYDCPLVLEEAYLSGNAQQNSIIKLAPKFQDDALVGAIHRREPMQVSAMLCREARVNDNLLDVQGAGINRVWRPSFPAPLNNFLGVMISLRPTQGVLENHQLKMVLQDEDGQAISTHEQSFVVGAAPDNKPGEECRVPVAFDMRNVVLPKASGYSIEISIDGQTKESVNFFALERVPANA